MVHAAESTHYYDRSGNPAYEQPNKSNGGMRPTTVRDARIHKLVPSVTEILKAQDKWALNEWKVDQGILAALTLPRREDETEADWLARVKQDSRAEARDAADRGNDIHASIGRYYEAAMNAWPEPAGHVPGPNMYRHVKGAVLCVRDAAPGVRWISERSFAHPIGYGGKSDLSAPGWVVDFKGKDFGPEDLPNLKTWDEHAQQLAAYAAGLNMPDARCAIVYFSRTTPGLSYFLEVPETDLRRGWQMFTALLAYWKAKNRYDSAFERND